MNARQRFAAAAIIGGGIASLVMDVVQYSWASAFERNRPSGAQDEETEAIVSVVRVLTSVAPRLFRKRDAAVIGQAIHYVFGIGFAAAYLYLMPRARPTVMRGTVFGTLLWLLSDRILIPVFKLGRPWSRYSIAERSNALASHIAYALVVEYSRPDV